ncbi:MAG: Hsp20/alpha crystallin family protein [Chloroflexi bacterium]|nr:Hsp20/alpha crystallin family protein [Chloroflexota bacterium]
MSFYVTTTPHHLARRWAAHIPNNEAVRSLPVDIRDEGQDYVLTAYVPGMKAEELNIQIVEDVLSIEGTIGQHEGEYLMSELSAGAFRRTLRLPAALNADKAEASIENGVLRLRLPKAESALPKTIKVASK